MSIKGFTKCAQCGYWSAAPKGFSPCSCKHRTFADRRSDTQAPREPRPSAIEVSPPPPMLLG